MLSNYAKVNLPDAHSPTLFYQRICGNGTIQGLCKHSTNEERVNTSNLRLKFQISLQVLACANLLVSMSFQVLHLALPTMHRLVPTLHFYLKIVREPRKVRDAIIYSSKYVHKE